MLRIAIFRKPSVINEGKIKHIDRLNSFLAQYLNKTHILTCTETSKQQQGFLCIKILSQNLLERKILTDSIAIVSYDESDVSVGRR